MSSTNRFMAHLRFIRILPQSRTGNTPSRLHASRINSRCSAACQPHPRADASCSVPTNCGYIEHMIAGEDPEVCVRLRQHGWKLRRLDIPMTRHDVAMRHFSQWWKRTVRSGHAYAEGAWMHRKSQEKPWRREVRSNCVLGLFFSHDDHSDRHSDSWAEFDVLSAVSCLGVEDCKVASTING